MPLIIITGLPCSGKTHRASQLAADYAARIAADPAASRRSVLHLPSNHARLDHELAGSLSTTQAGENENGEKLDAKQSLREQIYTSAAAEKTARAEEFSAIKRALGRDAVVIADGLNYIKGYRYQLWCEAKAAGTRCCVVHVAAGEEECRGWNEARMDAWGWRREETAAQEGGENNGGGDGEGHLMPESHTAVYGDRVVGSTSRSRSSSIDGINDGESRPIEGDNLTLKSLSRQGPSHTPQNGDISTALPPTRPADPQPPTTAATCTPLPPTASPPYTPGTLSSLQMRYEPPSPFSRWDTPLFTVPSTDPHPPYQAIWDACFPPSARQLSRKALSQIPRTEGDAETATGERAKSTDVKQHAATVLPAATAANALQVLESATGEVVTSLLAGARAQGLANGEGGVLSFRVPGPGSEPAVDAYEVTIPPGVPLSQPALQRLRRRYTALQRGGIAHGVGYQGGGRRGVVQGFVRFLEAEWGE